MLCPLIGQIQLQDQRRKWCSDSHMMSVMPCRPEGICEASFCFLQGRGGLHDARAKCWSGYSHHVHISADLDQPKSGLLQQAHADSGHKAVPGALRGSGC